jgi:hypothetical protein
VKQADLNQTLLCSKCGTPISSDEIAVTRKLINRGAREFYCVSCLADWFEVRPEDILERIEYFRASGCTLFEARSPE